MKLITSASIIAMGLFLAAPAYAGCPNGEFEYFTHTGAGTAGSPYVAVQNCVATKDKGGDVAWTGSPSYHLTPVMVDDDNDSSTPNVQLVVDGKAIVQGTPIDGVPHQHNKPKVYGTNGLAIGDGARVGTGPKCSEGTPWNGGCYRKVQPPSLNVQGRGQPLSSGWELIEDAVYTPAQEVHDGTAIGANTSVQHDHSTALGADAKSTDDHQVTLGTSEDTISTPGITSQKSKDRQSGPVEVVTSDADGHLATDGGAMDKRITDNKAKNDEQDGRLNGHDTTLADHETRITSNKNKNDEQDEALADHEGRITTNKAKNDEQDDRLNDHDTTLANYGGRISTNETNIGNLQADNTQQWDAIHANSDMLAKHGQHLDKLDKGVAIAMSLPDVWLGESKKFGVFGSVGGFDGETAVGFAAIGRLNQTWTLNAKFGADTSFDEIGWQVGAGAQW